MIKLRVQGLPGEVTSFADALDRAGLVLDRSRTYANRGESRYVRMYLDVEAPGTAREAGLLTGDVNRHVV